MTLVIALIASPAWSEDRTVPSNGVERVSAGLIFEGPINLANVEMLKASLRTNDTLLINSSDGDPAAGLALANVLRSRNVAVSVNGECIGVCADYVFLLAPRRSAKLAFSVLFTENAASELGKDLEQSPQVRKFLTCVSGYIDRHRLTRTALGRPGVAVSKDVLSAFGIEVGGEFLWANTQSWRESAQSAYPVPMLWMASVSECRPDH